jgi:hypothetical protein
VPRDAALARSLLAAEDAREEVMGDSSRLRLALVARADMWV